ncbi:MAG: rod shape-determining protein MreC [Betaproteobacteria bacterium]|nr:MAG: rod shape-determining protein MreC [Betaproteobacteria bacterium]
MEATPPPFFKRGPSPAFRFGVFALFAVVLMVLDARLKYLEPARQAISIILYPLQQMAAAPGAVIGRITDYFTAKDAVQTENSRLRDETLRQAAALQELEALRRENTELRSLLEAKARLTPSSVLAEVLYGARDPFSRKLIIDKGLTDAIQPGVAVVDSEGVIGQVTRVYPFVAEVTQISDKNQAVPVQNVRSGLRAIVFGNGKDGTLDLRFMPVSADVQVGDTLVTSGIDGVYPPGLPVARVIDIERNAALAFARITCAPLGGVDRRGHVLVLTTRRDLPERPVEPSEPGPKGKKPRRDDS